MKSLSLILATSLLINIYLSAQDKVVGLPGNRSAKVSKVNSGEMKTNNPRNEKNKNENENNKNVNSVSTGKILSSSTLAMLRDTIPLGRYKYFRIDDARYKIYMNSAINKDSVKLLIANDSDWLGYDKAHSDLKKVLAIDPYKNVSNYIDTITDFKEFALLNKKFLPYTAKVCIRQLTFNIKLLTSILNKPLSSQADISIMNAVIANLDVLVKNYIAPVGNVTFLAKYITLFVPNVRIRVFDKDKTELNNVQCYFITRKTCRDVSCATCLPSLDPCDAANIKAIINNPDKLFDCANPNSVNINFGYYHLFIIGKNKILYHEIREFDNNINFNEDSNEIKIFL
jgi:hypothetical protein